MGGFPRASEKLRRSDHASSGGVAADVRRVWENDQRRWREETQVGGARVGIHRDPQVNRTIIRAQYMISDEILDTLPPDFSEKLGALIEHQIQRELQAVMLGQRKHGGPKLAQFTSPCPECGSAIVEGMMIKPGPDGRYVHEICHEKKGAAAELTDSFKKAAASMNKLGKAFIPLSQRPEQQIPNICELDRQIEEVTSAAR